jgi:predicted nuclease of restriction endonuclease-like RecB superfamily
MLTRAQRVYHWDRRGNSISSDRLEDGCLAPLGRAIAVYHARIGDRLGDVRNAARAALEGLRPDRVEAIVNLLDEAASYEWPRGGQQAERRLRVWEAAAARHPVLDRETARLLVGAVLGVAPDEPGPARDDDGETVALLYADYPEFHRLAAFPTDYTPDALRADYDLAQAQALLYDAVTVQVEAHSDLRHIVQYARLSRLMHRIARGRGGAYRLILDGPNSLLRRTHAYGVDFAKFLAGLVQARDWQMRAEIVLRAGWRPFVFALASSDGLRSRVPAPSLFDSSLEEGLARKFGEARAGWRLRREGMLLEAGERVVVPDFVFTHEDGTEVALEIVGYWTPEYVTAKLDKLNRIRGVNLLVAVRRSLALGASRLPDGALLFKSRILLRDLMPALEAFRAHPPRARRRPARCRM